jgi:hypothetical protein
VAALVILMVGKMISIEQLKTLLRYDPETGKLFWLPRTPDIFLGKEQPAAHSCAIWNKRFAGKEALTAESGRGYRQGSLLGAKCFAHRAAWALASGQWPEGEVDHINGDRGDNRSENLRSTTRTENGRNQKLRKTNTSGVMGVSKTRGNRWQAHAKVDGVSKYLGTFSSKEEAGIARREADRVLGFHENHGRAA